MYLQDFPPSIAYRIYFTANLICQIITCMIDPITSLFYEDNIFNIYLSRIWSLILHNNIQNQQKQMYKHNEARQFMHIKCDSHIWIWSKTFEPPHDKTNRMISAPSKDSDQPGHPPRLIKVCPGWSESSLDAQAILLVLSWGGSFMHNISHSFQTYWQLTNTRYVNPLNGVIRINRWRYQDINETF